MPNGAYIRTSPDQQAITDRQMEVLRIFAAAHRDRCDAPTLRVIGEIMHIKSPLGIVCHLESLIRKGWIEVQPMTYRCGSSSSRYRLTDRALANGIIMQETVIPSCRPWS